MNTRLPRRRRIVWAQFLWAVALGVAPALADPQIESVELGLGGRCKLGCWSPLRVTVEGGATPAEAQLVAAAPDNEGTPVGVVGEPFPTPAGEANEQTLYVRVGKRSANLRVQLAVDSEEVDSKRLQTLDGQAVGVTDRLYVELSQAGEARPSLDTLRDEGIFTVASSSVTDLPDDAIGYDSFDAVVLLTRGGWLNELSPDDARIKALVAWVEAGGRLVLSCGEQSEQLLGPEGALQNLVPGKFVDERSLALVDPIQRYADPPDEVEAIDLRGEALPIAAIDAPQGVIEAFGGRSAEETPLVIRSPRGLGEVVFIALDLDAKPFAEWEGRATLLRRLLQLPIAGAPATPAPENDLANQLVSQLDVQLPGVQAVPFLLVVGLVIAYLALIGPGDYFFVTSVLRRVEATWITFPLIVLAASAAAYVAAYGLKGDSLRINQIEIVDVECASGLQRGSLITHLFSPNADRFDLELSAKTLDSRSLTPSMTNTAWLGRPGSGLGGMQSSGGDSTAAPQYRLMGHSNPQTGEVLGLPVPIWSSRTLFSRYLASTDRSIDAQLVPDRDGLVEGSLTNDTGVKLTDCRLLYGAWSWRLGALADGETTIIDPSVQPIKITTLIKQAQPRGAPETLDEITTTLSIGRRSGADSPAESRYLSDLDLTHRLDAGDALLLARITEGPRSELKLREEENAQRTSWVYARFLLPVIDPQ